MPRTYPWEAVYELAVSETDLVKTHAYVEAAEALIFVRGLEAKEQGHLDECAAEKRSIQATLEGLLRLKTLKLGWPLASEELQWR